MKVLTNTENFLALKVKDSGYDFFIENDIWILSKDVKLPLINIQPYIESELFYKIRNTLAYVATTLSSAYTRKFYYALKKLINFNNNKLDEIDGSLLSRFYNAFVKTDYTHVESIKYFLSKLHELYPEVVHKDIHDKITAWKIVKPNKSSSKSELKAGERPLKEPELVALISGATKLYNNNEIRINDYLLTLFLVFTGGRPLQVSLLKAKDLCLNENCIKIPRVKQGCAFRKEFTEIKLSDFLADKLRELRTISECFIQHELKMTLSLNEISEIPLFIDSSFFSRNYESDSILKNKFDSLHMTSKRITARLQYVCYKLKIKGLFDYEKINCRRLRVSFATRVANKGYNLQIIARVLDHTGLKSVGSYAKNNTENARRINEATSSKLLSYSNMFLNKESQSIQVLRNEMNAVKHLLKAHTAEHNTLLKGSISRLNRDMSNIFNKLDRMNEEREYESKK